MTTITFKENLKLDTDKYNTVADFLGTIDYSLIYEEYLERKLLEVKKAGKEDFINL